VGVLEDLPNILNMTVPQVGHLPLMALRPFFMVSSTPSAISFLALHLTQYPSAIKMFTVVRFMRQTVPYLSRHCLVASIGKESGQKPPSSHEHRLRKYLFINLLQSFVVPF